MEKRGERKEGVPVLALAKCLLASYVLTLLLLCLRPSDVHGNTILARHG